MRTILLIAGLVALSCWADPYDVSLDAFPRLPGEGDDSPRFQRAVNVLGDGGVLFVPRGEYAAAQTIWVTNGASVLLHKSAMVRAVAKMEHLFHVDLTHTGCWTWGEKLKENHPHDQGMFFKGGHLDGNGLASCLYLNGFFHFTMRDVSFMNGYPYGLHVGKMGCELVADNLHLRTLKSGLAGSVAVYTEGNDSYYSNIVAVDYTIGLKTTGGANAFSHFHVWGGSVPPRAGERVPEMLENSVCFDLGGTMNLLRDCYADTATIGFKVSGWGHQIVSSWFLNNPAFGLKDITVVQQNAASTDLLIADCCFRGAGEHTKLYEGPGGVKWRDMTYSGFPKGAELPAEIVSGRDFECATADEWEYADGIQRFVSAPGEFVAPKSARALEISLAQKPLLRRFPEAGPGSSFVFKIRATDEVTKRVEFSFSQKYGRIWGKTIEIGTDWQEVRIPFGDLRYFIDWGLKPLTSGEVPDARKMEVARFMFGNWLTDGSADKAHGFEVSSLRVVGRD